MPSEHAHSARISRSSEFQTRLKSRTKWLASARRMKLLHSATVAVKLDGRHDTPIQARAECGEDGGSVHSGLRTPPLYRLNQRQIEQWCRRWPGRMLEPESTSHPQTLPLLAR